MSAAFEVMFPRPTTADPERPLRLPLGLDAVATGAVGLLALLGSPVLGDLLGTPATLTVPVGLFLLGYAAAIGVVGTRPRVNRAIVRGAAVLNLAWVIISVATVTGPFALTALGSAVILAQAIVVAIFAECSSSRCAGRGAAEWRVVDGAAGRSAAPPIPLSQERARYNWYTPPAAHVRYYERGGTGMMTAEPIRRPVGQLLRGWRERRRLSQLDLALQADISTRHLSFVENGRAAPSREMLLHLAERLELPLRERNDLLLAAGYAPVYSESPLDSPRLSAVRAAVRQILAGHEPYPAVVIDRHWQLVEMNASVDLFIAGIAPALLAPPANVLRISLHPEGMAPRIANLGEWRGHLLGRLRRQIALTAEAGLGRLYDELRAYPCDQPIPDVELPGAEEIVVPLRLRHEGGELAFISTVATFGTPLDITVAELAIESFFPADAATVAVLRESAVGGRQSTEG